MSESDAAVNSVRPVNPEFPSNVSTTAGIVAGVGLLVSLVGFLVGSEGQKSQMWWMLLVNFVFWTGLAQGAVIWSAILRTGQASWAAGVNRLGRAAVSYLLFSLVLFVILYLGRQHWLTWAGNTAPEFKEKWLNENFMFGRNFAGLVLMTILSFVHLAIYKKAEAGGTDADHALVNKFSIAFILAYVTIFSFLAFDMIMSLEPYWYSTLFGIYYVVANQYSAMAAMILIATLLRVPLGMDRYLGPKQFSDMGNLMMGFGILFTGFIFAQWLTIWYGNIPEEVSYLLPRVHYMPWKVIGIFVLVVACFLPFLFLQSHVSKRTPARLSMIAVMVLVGIMMERWLLVIPALSPEKLAGLTLFSWGIPLLCGGVFVSVMVNSLRKDPNPSPLDLALTAD